MGNKSVKANGKGGIAELIPPKSTVNQLMGLYIIVSFSLTLSWFLGSFSFSFLWVFLIIFGLFIIWKTRLRKIVEYHLNWHKENLHRKRALRQEETAEWLNFLINRWWVFSGATIEELIKKRINKRLLSVKPTFLDHLELIGFTFGDITPSVRYVKVFECSDGVPGFKPACWANITVPPMGLNKMSTYQVVLEASVASRCDDFRMVYRARLGGKQVGLNFDIAVEEMNVAGKLQIILHMSMDVPFPHVTKATITFVNLPEVSFNVRVLSAVQLMEVPLLKTWIHMHVMEGITKALVDPGKIDLHIAKVGPVQSRGAFTAHDSQLAQGVLTVYVRGTPATDAGEEVRYTRLSVGKSKRQTVESPATQSWEDCCSFFVNDLRTDKLVVKSKCKRLLTTVTLEKHSLDLASFPFQVRKLVDHDVENKDGSLVSLQLDYSELPPLNLDDVGTVNILQTSGVLYVCVHCATNVIASDTTGSSDPYCVVFCDRRRVLTTPYVIQNRNPHWDAHTEFFVKDYSQCNLSFYVFDWDGTNIIEDDFLGSTSLSMSQQEPCVVRKTLTLGYNKYGEGQVVDAAYGQVTVSAVFRPVPSVERSERFRLLSTESDGNFLYTEDMVSPGSMSIGRPRIPTLPDLPPDPGQAGGRKMSRLNSPDSIQEEDILQDKIFVDLTLLQAKDLVPMDRNGYSDPFCVVKLGDDKIFTSNVKKKTLFPKWNESFTFQVAEDSGMLEIDLYDKDIFSDDFLGKVLLTLDQLKELSYKCSNQWYPLQHIKSGQLQLCCTITARETIQKLENKSSPEPSHKDTTQLENDVFLSPESTQQLKSTPTVRDNGVDVKGGNLPRRGPQTSTPLPTPLKDPDPHLRRSATDLNEDKGLHRSNSMNSFAAGHGMESISSDMFGDRLYGVRGKVMGLQGLPVTEGSVYCKVRIYQPNAHRIRRFLGNRVVAKSAMVKASHPTFNLPFEVDHGMGTSSETQLIFDIKSDKKERLVTKSFTLKYMFDGPGGAADKVQKVLALDNHAHLEVFLQHSPPDSALVNRRAGGRFAGWSRSFRRDRRS